MNQSLPRLVVFDIDETLTESKTTIDAEMADLLARLAKRTQVAVISGAPFKQCVDQVVGKLPLTAEMLSNVSIIPTSGAALYTHADGSWRALYAIDLTGEEKKRVYEAFAAAFKATGFDPHAGKIYGELIEDRGSQISFSALGADAPVAVKKPWDPDFAKRKKIVAELEPLLPGFSVKMGGTTSIDITRKGIDKAYGLSRLVDYLSLQEKDVLYVGDALFSGGNDSAVLTLGVKTAAVPAPGLDDTKAVIKRLLALPE